MRSVLVLYLLSLYDKIDTVTAGSKFNITIIIVIGLTNYCTTMRWQYPAAHFPHTRNKCVEWSTLYY